MSSCGTKRRRRAKKPSRLARTCGFSGVGALRKPSLMPLATLPGTEETPATWSTAEDVVRCGELPRA
eukprot:7050756-Alexandrium_andersonii.AAC.1